MTRRQRSFISRSTALVIGVVLIWTGIRIIPATQEVAASLPKSDRDGYTSRREREQMRDRNTLVWLPAIGLIGAGGALAAFGLLGERMFSSARK